MKLRIRGNSVRLRVSQTELSQLARTGYAADAVRFGPRAALEYRLEIGPHDRVQAEFEGDVLTVRLPGVQFERWLDPGEIAITASQDIGAGDSLAILIEKDFACLAPRDEDQSDLFPNPGTDSC
jgi:hypothetical protein